jgi:hypothetical protein
MSVLGNSTVPKLAGEMASSSPADSVLSAVAALPAVNTWTLLGTILLAIVIYDQSISDIPRTPSKLMVTDIVI